MKSWQAEAKTNLQAIKTSEVAFNAERGCFIGVAKEAAQPAAAAGPPKTAPYTWGVGQPPTVPLAAGWCAIGGSFAGVFTDIGFKATGNVMYVYGVDATNVPAPGLYTTVMSCGLYAPGPGATAAAGAAGMNNFVAVAKVDLDGDGTVSTWDSTTDHGATDCTTGVY